MTGPDERPSGLPVERLAGWEFFAGLTGDQVERIAACGTEIEFAADRQILAAGRPADRWYLIERGKVVIEIDGAGRGLAAIETIGVGEVLGISWLLPPYRWAFDARAVEPTAAIAIDAETLRAECDADPVLGYELYRSFAAVIHNRLVATRVKALDLYGATVP